MLPVNWRGDGQEFVLLSGNAKEGGMIDGHLRRVVMFPDDGHPDLAANVLDLTGDARDEIVLWDQERVWIYTQDRPFKGERIYAPIRNPDYNESNYRTVVSRPGSGRAGVAVERPRGGDDEEAPGRSRDGRAGPGFVHDFRTIGRLVRHAAGPGGPSGDRGGAVGPRLSPGREAKGIAPGDTIWSVHGGRYHAGPQLGGRGYAVRLVGRDGGPIRVRAVPGQRATIDGGLDILTPATFVEIRDLEIIVSQPRPPGRWRPTRATGTPTGPGAG